MPEKLRLAMIGLGGISKLHLRGFTENPHVEVVAACDTSPEQFKATVEEFGEMATYTDAKKMLKTEKLDGVSIATPNKFHAPLTLAALDAGLHVFCEKPMAMTVLESEKMEAKAKEARKNLMINFSYRFSPMSFALKQQVDAGIIGDIYFGRTIWHRRRGCPGFGGWFGTKALSGGGPLIDLGVHRLDLALWLMGYPEPVSVSGSCYNHLATDMAKKQKKHFDVEDLACGLVKFANGASLVLEASWAINIQENEQMSTTLYGKKGGLVQRNIHQTYEFEAEVYTEEDGALYTKRLDRTMTPVPSPYEEFVNSILEKRAPMATAEQGVKVMKILEGIYKSAEKGKEIVYKKSK